MMTLKPVRWEAAGTYREVWKTAIDMETQPERFDHERVGKLIEGLRRVRVITVDAAQIEALPRQSQTLTRRHAVHLRPPFPYTYLSLGRVAMGQRFLGVGAMLAETDGDGWVAALFAAERDSDGIVPLGEHWVAPGLLTDVGSLPLLPYFTEEAGVGMEYLTTLTAVVFERVIAVLLLLDGTVGTELVPATVSRQVRRATEREGGQIALVIQIGGSRSRQPLGSVATSGAIYTHRFERRAHFACITQGPHFKEEKLAAWCPRHGMRACRREFRRATIVGPPSKPFVPKIRVLGGQDGTTDH